MRGPSGADVEGRGRDACRDVGVVPAGRDSADDDAHAVGEMVVRGASHVVGRCGRVKSVQKGREPARRMLVCGCRLLYLTSLEYSLAKKGTHFKGKYFAQVSGPLRGTR